MAYDLDETIAAAATASGGSARAAIRISGPETVAKLARLFTPAGPARRLPKNAAVPQRFSGCLRVAGDGESLDIPCDLLLWPTSRSYTRQPSAELHMLGSPPLVAAILAELARAGVRAAKPGEFTLRAFLAGRVDLTQAEAVLGVIDAQGRGDLDAALDQLAGGLSRPLHEIREELLAVLAELEAGLDFAEEDIEFIDRETLRERLSRAQGVVSATLKQMSGRSVHIDMPRVVIVGPPNVGKSTLFNALVERHGLQPQVAAIVSPEPGATRDFVAAPIDVLGIRCELIDTAGEDLAAASPVAKAAQQATAAQRERADIRIRCIDATDGGLYSLELLAESENSAELVLQTKADLTGNTNSAGAGKQFPDLLRCSGLTGAGLEAVVGRLRRMLTAETMQGGFAQATAARCLGSLQQAEHGLAAAIGLIDADGEELIAAELRLALDAIGEIVGAICTDDILDRVFSQFCIGK